MRTRTVCIGVGCLLLGVVASAVMPSLRAQAAPEPCQAPWDVVVGANTAQANGWHAVRWNRCTGETFVFSAEGERGDVVKDTTAWTKHPVR